MAKNFGGLLFLAAPCMQRSKAT